MSILDELKQLYKTTNDSTVCKNYIMNIDGTEYDNKNIVLGTFSITEKLCSSQQLKFGECNASMLKVKMVAGVGDINKKKISVSQTINGNSINIGVFNVDSCVLTENKEYRDVVAYDNMYLFNCNVSSWYNELEFPITERDMLISLCNYVGVELADVSLITGEIEIEKTINPEDLKAITVLKCIAELNAGFFRAASDGKIEFVTLNTKDIDDYLEVRHYKTLKTENFAMDKITRLTIRTDEDDIGASSGDGDNAYVIEDNFLLYGSSSEKLKGIADIIYEAIKDISYVPYTAEQIGLPYLRCGSRISYKLVNGESFEGLVLQRTLSGTQALKDVIKTSGTKTTDEVFGIEKDIIKLKNKTNRLKRTIEQTLLAIENLEDGLYSEINQTADELNVLVKKVANMGDMGVTSIVIMYTISDSATEGPSDTAIWSLEAPKWVDGKYIWQKTVTTYNDGNVYESNAVCITGATGAAGEDGEPGEAGKGISSIINYYLASSSSSGVTTSTSGWTTAVQTITSSNKYLWNYEKITYTDNTTLTTTPVIIGVFGNTGATGKGISSIVEYYLASTSSSEVTTSTSGWTTTMQSTTTSKKYLWNYEKITYTDGTTSNSTVRIIGTHGATGGAGKDGLTISNIVPQYYVSNSKTALYGGSWSTTAPTWSKGKYVWTRSQITYSDNTTKYTTAVCDASWEVANSIEAKLELKVNTEDLISELNASADVIKLLANRLIIESSYFKLGSDGKAEMAGGKIGSWNIGTKLSTSAEAYVSPGQYEWSRVLAKMNGTASLTTAETTYLDLNADGSIGITDLMAIKKIILGTALYSSFAKAKKSTVNMEINPNAPDKLIKLSALTPWRRTIESYFGVDKCYAPTVMGGAVIGDIIETTSGVNLDTLNSNLFVNMNWETLLTTNATTQTSFTIKDITAYKFISLELRFTGSQYMIAQMIFPAFEYSRCRSISGHVDSVSANAIGQLIFTSTTTVKAFVTSQVNNNQIYIVLRGIKG
ncbi:MAG: hypothetical protein UF228_06615 [Lachnospiraceae bacterium]|nr:hypothetical protein [Lachnospiraceae bacterium]